MLLGYSLAKRFTWGAHAWLGVALALAPGGAWIAMGAAPGLGIVALMLGVVTWLLGFDVLYSLQDERFDRGAGLHSIPARFGTTRALVISAASHVVTVACFAAAGALLHRHAPYFAGVALAGAILDVGARRRRQGKPREDRQGLLRCERLGERRVLRVHARRRVAQVTGVASGSRFRRKSARSPSR